MINNSCEFDMLMAVRAASLESGKENIAVFEEGPQRGKHVILNKRWGNVGPKEVFIGRISTQFDDVCESLASRVGRSLRMLIERGAIEGFDYGLDSCTPEGCSAHSERKLVRIGVDSVAIFVTPADDECQESITRKLQRLSGYKDLPYVYPELYPA